MKTTLKKYKKIIKEGDMIKTNCHGGLEGKVREVRGRSFIIQDGAKGNYELFFEDSDASHYIEIANGLVIKKEKTVVAKEKRKIFITLEKTRTGIAISLKIPEEIEKYYKEVTKGELQQSKSWINAKGEGAQFYMLNDLLKESERKIDNEIFTDYGDGLIDGERINTAILRTVGASKGIKITSENFNRLNNIDLEFYIKRLGEFVKKLWETSISEKTIKSVITFEF